ncbi:hypothetical protein Tco_1445501 [Tanacetum coccineum]
MANLSEDIQCAGSDTRPPMLDRTDFASWQQRIRLYCRGKENGVNILKSIDEGPFQMGTFRETLAEGNEGALHLAQRRDYSLLLCPVCQTHQRHAEHQDDHVQNAAEFKGNNYVVDSHADYTSDSNMISYDQYVKDNAVLVVQSNVSSVPNDAYMMILNEMHEQPA